MHLTVLVQIIKTFKRFFHYCRNDIFVSDPRRVWGSYLPHYVDHWATIYQRHNNPEVLKVNEWNVFRNNVLVVRHRHNCDFFANQLNAVVRELLEVNDFNCNNLIFVMALQAFRLPDKSKRTRTNDHIERVGIRHCRPILIPFNHLI